MKIPKNLPNRQTIRLQNFDYSSKGAYFITLVCNDRIHYFGKIENEKMILNDRGKLVFQEWKNSIHVRPNISLGEFIIMPDHMHMILHIESKSNSDSNQSEWTHKNPKSPSNTIGAIIRGFKGASTKKINMLLNSEYGRIAIRSDSDSIPTDSAFITNKIWQRNYYEHIIRDEISYKRIENYIIDNPKNWKKKKKEK